MLNEDANEFLFSKMKHRKGLFAGVLCICLLLTFVPAGISADMAGENELHPFVPFDGLPDNMKLILSEYVSPPALDFIRSGRPPNEDMIRAGVRRENFEGEIYPIYHEFGAVYIFIGSGRTVHVNGGEDAVEAPEGVITVIELWSTEKLESIMGKRTPPAPASERIHAGIQTYAVSDKYFGVQARVVFPQHVTTNFNIYTTHVVFTNGQWFESAVGQYAWWGGQANRPNAIFWVSWLSTQRVIVMDSTPGVTSKNAIIETLYFAYGGGKYPSMVVTDVDLNRMYSRAEAAYFATTSRVTLVQEQITANPVTTPWATFRDTLIKLTLNPYIPYEDWTSTSGPAVRIENPPMEFRWADTVTYHFYTRGGYT